ncbi:MAG TPA: hypothetical protein VM865_08005 [Acidobacteriaceae bacterium]|jgi:hypothetical protein|nr:hypothetical protein [Acidobacteriaceae bacterium]
MSTAALPETPTPEPAVPIVKLDITNNWTGRNELPFELVAERVLEMEAEEAGQNHTGALIVSFGKPVLIENLGWACPFKMSAMGREHVSPARGIDAVDALQAAFAMVAKQLTGMSRRHRITFNGSEDLGFVTADAGAAPKAAGCPVMNGTASV